MRSTSAVEAARCHWHAESRRISKNRTAYVLLWGSGLCGTAGDRSLAVAFRILSAIQVRTTLGCRPLSISNIIVVDEHK